MELLLSEEKHFGPKLFTVAIVSENDDRLTLRKRLSPSPRKVFSEGCYGRGFDHWAGDPWSPDSRHVVLFQADVSGGTVKTSASLFDVARRQWTEILSLPEVASHHMWSPGGTSYLFRGASTWHLIDLGNLRARVVGKMFGDYPRHCYLISEEHILLLEGSCKLLSVKSLETIWEEPLPDDPTLRAYSLFDPTNRRVYLGINPSLVVPSLNEFVTAARWYRFDGA
jgi:hypothetical protein